MVSLVTRVLSVSVTVVPFLVEKITLEAELAGAVVVEL